MACERWTFRQTVAGLAIAAHFRHTGVVPFFVGLLIL